MDRDPPLGLFELHVYPTPWGAGPHGQGPYLSGGGTLQLTKPCPGLLAQYLPEEEMQVLMQGEEPVASPLLQSGPTGSGLHS